MATELEVLKDVARRLEAGGLPYMLTGSFAANYYTTPRMTRDIDLVIELRPEDIGRFGGLLGPAYYCDTDMVKEAVANRGMFNVIHQEAVVKVDFVVRKDSPYRRAEFERRRPVDLEGQKVWIVAPEDLILSKLDWANKSGSSVQMDDARNLLRTSTVDAGYLDRWAKTLGLEKVLAEAKA